MKFKLILGSVLIIAAGLIVWLVFSGNKPDEKIITDEDLVLGVIQKTEEILESREYEGFNEIVLPKSSFEEYIQPYLNSPVDEAAKVDVELKDLKIVEIDDKNAFVTVTEHFISEGGQNERNTEFEYIYALEKTEKGWMIYEQIPSMFIKDVDDTIQKLKNK